MIITRSPLRITLGGGGTDLPSYYQEYGGFLIAASIDKYVYININSRFINRFLLKYSHLEEADTLEEIEHPIIREALRFVGVKDKNLEISSMADIPAGTGLGSSGSFVTALLKALRTYQKDFIHQKELAEQACHIEIDILKEPIGKQDQYISSYGGITCFEFSKDGNVEAFPLKISEETLFNLEDNLLLFFTGYSRSASLILKDQDDKSKNRDKRMLDSLHLVKDIGYQSKEVLQNGDLYKFAKLLDIHWQNKKKRNGMSNDNINELYDYAMNNGAIGGKLIGAGGGGFLMFYAKDNKQLRYAMMKIGIREVRFKFDFEGTKVII
jgi:D-glycero-alpha-D-manno-heptose-7-phosphate kinase